MQTHPQTELSPLGPDAFGARLSRKSLWRRIVAGVGLLFVFVFSLIAAVLVHLDVPAVRNLVVHQVNGVLASLPADKVNIGGMAWLSLRGIKVSSADAEIAGVGHVQVDGVLVRIDPVRTVLRVLSDAIGKRNRIRVEVNEVTVDAVDFLLVPGERPPSPPKEESASSNELVLTLDRLFLGHAYVHGTLKDGRVIDADIDQLEASGAMDGHHAEGTAKVRLVARALVPKPVEVALDGQAWMGLNGNPDRRGNANVHVKAGAATASAVASILNDAVDARVDVEETPAEAIRALAPTAPVYQPVSAHIRADGTLPHLDFHLETRAGRGTVTSDGSVQLDNGPSVDAKLSAREVDIAAFTEGGGSSKLGLDLHAQLRLMPSRGTDLPVAGVVSLKTLPGLVGDKSIPVVTANASIVPTKAHATAEIAEPGLPIRLEVERDASGRIRAAIDAAAASLADVPLLNELGLHPQGRLSLAVLATMQGESIDARAQIDAKDLNIADVGVRSVSVMANAAGPLRSPRGQVSGRITGIASGPYKLESLSLSARGSPERMNIAVRGNGGTLKSLWLDGSLARGPTTRFTGASARIVRGKQAVDLHLKEIAYAPEDIALDGLVISGLGSPIQVSARRSSASTTARVQAPDIELVRIAALLGIDPRKLSGRGAIDVALEMGARKVIAKGQIQGTALRYETTPKADVNLAIDIKDRALKADLGMKSGDIGAAELHVDGTLGALPQQPGAFEGAQGKVNFSSEGIKLGRLCQVMTCSGDFGRAVVSVGAAVSGHLELVRQKRSEAGEDTQVELGVEVDDRRGVLAKLDAKTRFDLARLLKTHAPAPDMPLEANVSIEPRSVDDLPVSYRPPGLSGELKMQASVKGKLERPSVALSFDGEKLQYKVAGRPTGQPLDAHVETKFDDGKAVSNIEVRSGEERLLKVAAQINVPLGDILAGRTQEPVWNAGLDAEIQRFPLSSVPGMAESGMQGTLSGKIAVTGIHQKPLVTGDLKVEDLRTARESIGSMAISLKADEQHCTATIDARRATGEAAAVVRANAGCKWSQATVPGLDPSVPFDVALDTTAFPLAALSPALGSVVRRLRGTLDMHVRAQGHPDPAAQDLNVQGKMQIQGGNMMPLAIGREIHNIDLAMSASLDGVKIEKLSGDMGGGHFDATGSVDLRDRRLAAARVDLRVPRLHPLPITIEGASMGTIWGEVNVGARVENQKLLIDVKMPTLRFELPPERTASLEKLEDNPAVQVKQALGPEKKEEEEEAVGGGPPAAAFLPPDMVVSLEFGNNVGISRDEMKIELQTPKPPENPKLTIEGETPRLDGAIQILGGRVPLMGKVFRIERGTVRFGGTDPSNPSLDIDAFYEGDEAAVDRIDIHIAGTPKDIKLTMTSSPPKSQNELLAILAGLPGADGGGGSSGDTSSGQGESGTATAAGVVGSAVLNSAVNDLLKQTVIPVRASFSGTNSAAASVEVTDRIRVEYIRKFGQPTANGQPSDRNLVALDWRFRPRWMLRTQVGDIGTTSLDVLWQRWY